MTRKQEIYRLIMLQREAYYLRVQDAKEKHMEQLGKLRAELKEIEDGDLSEAG